jgi:hypothetical protein
MPIRKNASMEKYIKDFEKSDAPQFKDKSKDKRVQMAVAAKLQAMGKKKMEESELTEIKSFTVDSESASDSDKITDFLTKNDISFKKEGSKIKISLDRSTPKASSILGKLKSLAKFKELNEAKGTLCGRCGHVHVKGTPCPRPFKEGKESTTFKVGDKVTYLGHPAEITKVNKEMTGAITYNVSYDKGTGKTKATNISNKDGEIKEGEDKPDFLDLDKDGNKTEPMKRAAKDAKKNLKEGLKDFTDLQLQDLKMKYHSQISAEKDQKKKEYLKQDLKDLEAELTNRKSKKINESRENDIVASIDPNHPLATKDVEQWNDEDMKEYKKLRDKKHGNDTIKDMLKRAVTKKLKEVDVDPTAGSVVVSKMTPPADIKKYTTQGIDVQLKEIYDFFEDNMDDDNYVDVSGQSVEMYMEELLMEFEDRLKGIPEESRQAGLRAIKTFWINMIKDWNPNLTTPHRAPITEAKHPIFEVKEYDYEGQMARTQLISIVKNAKSLFDSIGDKTQLQAWVQSKLTKAEDYLNAVRSYLEGESISNTAPLMVNNEPARDDEGTALNIGDVVRAANGGIYQAVHSYSEGKPFLTPFDLKKRKPTNLRERHYFDNISEDVMSITKKMYKVMSHNQTKGGFTK